MKTGRDSDRFSNISLTECQEALSERLWKTKSDTLCQELTFAHEALVLIPLSGSTFVIDKSWGGVYGDSCFHLCIPKLNTSNVSSVLTSSYSKKTMGGFLPLSSGCFHTLWPHNYVQTPYKSDFCIIGFR